MVDPTGTAAARSLEGRTSGSPAARHRPDLRVGDRVELRVRYTNGWSDGFEVAELVDGGYSVRRLSDGRLLPSPTGQDDVREDNRRP